MRTPSGRSPSGLLTAALIVVALGLALFLFATGIASYQSGSVRRAWAATIGTKEEVLGRFPRRAPSDSALQLEELTPSLGIVTEARHRMKARRPPLDERTRKFTRFKRAMADYAATQMAKSERSIDPAPEAVLAYLEEHAAQLAQVRRLLIESEEVYWEMELEQMFAAPIPNLLGHLDLVKLLLVDALVAIDRDQRSRALEDLDAVWRLCLSIRRDPMMITQLIAMSDVRMLNAVLRQLPDAPAVWRERLAEYDYRDSFTQAMELEAWVWVQAPLDSGIATEIPQIMEKIAYGIGRPYVRFCMAHASNALREQLQNLKAQPAICDYDLSSANADLVVELPRWNKIGRMMVPHLSSALDRVARLELDLELTRQVLELDAGLTKSTNASSSIRSRACPEDAWLYDWSRPGQVTLSFEREPEWESSRGFESTRTFTLGRAAKNDRQTI